MGSNGSEDCSEDWGKGTEKRRVGLVKGVGESRMSRFERREPDLKRQRLGGDGSAAVGAPSMQLAPLGLLPRPVQAVSTKFKAGLAGSPDMTLAWVWAQGSLQMWPIEKRRHGGKEALVRLSAPSPVEEDDFCFVHAFKGLLQDGAPGVITIDAAGKIACWPSIGPGRVPVVGAVPLGRGEMVCCGSGHGNRVLVGTTAGKLWVIWISNADLDLRVAQVHDEESAISNASSNAGAVTEFMGRFLGFSEPNGAVPQKRGHKETGKSGKMISDVLVTPDKCLVACFEKGKRIVSWRFDEDAQRTERVWQFSSAQSDIASSLGERPKAEAVEVFQVEPSEFEGGLIMFAKLEGKLSVHAFEGVSAPTLRASSTTVQLHESSSSGLRCGYKRGGTSSSAFAVEEIGKMLHVHLLRVPLRSGSWFHTEKADLTNGWFAVCPLESASFDACILTATGALAIRFEKASTHSTLRASGSLHGQHRRRPAVAQAPGLSFEEARLVLQRVFRAFEQELSLGRDGMAVVFEDNKWEALIATPSRRLHHAIEEIVKEGILDRNPTHRWADKALTNASSRQNAQVTDADFFNPRIIKRHLASKRARFLSGNGLLGFLERAGILQRVEDRTARLLLDCAWKLEACERLYEVHVSGNNNFVDELIASAVEGRDLAGTPAAQLRKELEKNGLSFSDMFYAKVTRIHEFLIELEKHLSSSDSTEKVVNSVRMAVHIAGKVSVENGILRRRSHALADAPTWLEDDEIHAALLGIVRCARDEISNSTASTNWNIFTSIYAEVVNAGLGSLRRKGKLNDELAWDFIQPLVEKGEKEPARTLSVLFNCPKGLFHTADSVEDLKFFMDQAICFHLQIRRISNESEGVFAIQCFEEDGILHFTNAGGGESGQWLVEEWIEGDESKKMFTFRDVLDGSWLSFSDSCEWTVSSSDQPGENEKFQKKNLEGRGGQGILAWDGITFLGVDRYGRAVSAPFAEERRTIAPYVFERLFEDNGLKALLDLIEDDSLNEEIKEFLSNQEESRLYHKLCWLEHLRRHNYREAKEHLLKEADLKSADHLTSLAKICAKAAAI